LSVNAGAAEHPADRNMAEPREQVRRELQRLGRRRHQKAPLAGEFMSMFTRGAFRHYGLWTNLTGHDEAAIEPL
jgi:hypothetical protein